MAKVKCKVIGPEEVLGVAAPGEVEVDDEVYNLPAMVQGGHVEVIAETAPKETAAPSGRSSRSGTES